MRLIIEGKTNRDDVMVNTAKVTLPSGDVYTIDRDCTEYTISTVTGYLSKHLGMESRKVIVDTERESNLLILLNISMIN